MHVHSNIFIVAKDKQPKCALRHGRYTNMLVHSLGGNSVLERKGVLTPARMWMDPGNIVIREESRTKMLYIFLSFLYIFPEESNP